MSLTFSEIDFSDMAWWLFLRNGRLLYGSPCGLATTKVRKIFRAKKTRRGVAAVAIFRACA
jgi:hypothetical protein